MSSRYPQSKQLTSYYRIFLTLFIFFTSFQFANHQNFAGWGNYPHFLDLLQYPPKESGCQKGLSIPTCLELNYGQKCPAAIDGMLVLRTNWFANETLEMMEGISPNLPCQSIIKLYKHEAFTFRIHFAESIGKEYFLSINEIYPGESGVFLKSEAGLRRLLDFSDIAQNTRDRSSLEVGIDCRMTSFKISLDSKSFDFKAPEPIHRVLLKIDQLPSTDPILEPATLVDRVEVKEIREDGTSKTIAEGDFNNIPDFFDLSLHSWLHQDSAAYIFLSFLLLAATAFLFDWLLVLILGTDGLVTMNLSGLFFVLLPFQGVTLSVLRASLALPFISVLYCICMLAIAKFFLIARHGIVVHPLSRSRKRQLVQFGLFGLGMAVYGIAVVDIWVELIGEYHFSRSISILLVLTPLFIILGGLLSARAYPGMLWFASVTQFFSFYFIQIFYNIKGKTAFLIIVLIPWIASTCIHVLKCPRRKIFILQVYLSVILIVLLGFTEVLIRGVPSLNDRFNLELSVRKMWCEPEAIPSLFKNRTRPNVVEYGGHSHSIKKSPDVFRVLCLGSSSTQGAGIGDWSRYSYPAQLESILEESTLLNVEVINGGIGGASFYMLEIHFKEVFLQLDPDLVIIYYGGNGDNLESRLVYDRMKREVAEAPFIESAEELYAAMHLRWNPPWMIRGFLRLAKLRTFMAIMSCIEQWRGMRNAPKISSGPYNPIMNQSPEEVVSFCVKQGKAVVLVPEVFLADVHNGTGKDSHWYGYIFKSIAKKYSGQHIYYKSVLDSFTPELADSYLIDNVHMNSEGCHFLAKQITEFLFEEGIVDRK